MKSTGIPKKAGPSPAANAGADKTTKFKNALALRRSARSNVAIFMLEFPLAAAAYHARSSGPLYSSGRSGGQSRIASKSLLPWDKCASNRRRRLFADVALTLVKYPQLA